MKGREGGSLGSIVGGVKGAALMLFLFYMNVSGMCRRSHLPSPTFDGIGFLGSPPRQVVYLPGSYLGDCLPFPCGELGG